MASRHSGHRGRVKSEFLARGMEGWPPHRVLEILLFYAIPQGDVNDLAHELIERFGSLSGVFDAAIEDLMAVPGVGEHSAILLKMMPQIGQAYVADRASKGELVRCTVDAVELLRPYFYGARNEMVYVLCLDGKNKALGVRKISEGTLDSAEINVRRLVEEAMSLRAARVYIAHNHVSNLAMPSLADWMTTDTLKPLLRAMGIELLDHIVFVDDDAVSMRDTDPLARGRKYEIT